MSLSYVPGPRTRPIARMIEIGARDTLGGAAAAAVAATIVGTEVSDADKEDIRRD